MTAAAERSGVNTYRHLSEWFREDIGDLRSAEAIERTRRLVREVEELGQAAPEWLRDIRDMLGRVAQERDSREQTVLLSRSLRDLFVGTLLTEDTYQEHCQSLVTGETLPHLPQSLN